MGLVLSAMDVAAFKCLILLALLYGIMFMAGHSIVHLKHVKPLGVQAPLDKFSEGRAIVHVIKLSKEIGGRQEGKAGLGQAARYLRTQMEMISSRAASGIRIDIDETVIEGTFNMLFLGHSVSLSYRGHTNLAMRISSADSKVDDPSVLVNGHFDSPLGSPGAGDCASCVASMLEVARLIIDSRWIPPHPVIFLFNGAEELFLLGSQGFMKSHKWKDSIGAFINVEASGTRGPDLVCQSGPGSWPSLIYAQSAVYPMAHSAAQDFFSVIPGDTDYRVFAVDYGDIPGLDIIFLLGGYFYHTSFDTVERLLPGCLQARGENLFSIMKAFASSPDLRNTQQRKLLEISSGGATNDRAIFFDYLSWIMIFYSRQKALILHSLPMFMFLLSPFFLNVANGSAGSFLLIFFDLLKGLMLHTLGVLLAVIVPVIFAVLRLLFSSYAMNWFCRPYLALLMFVPSALAGLIIPRFFQGIFPSSFGVSLGQRVYADNVHFWGAFGFYAFLTLAHLLAGLGGGFLAFFTSASMIPAWVTFHMIVKSFGSDSLMSVVGFVLPLVPCLAYLAYFAEFLMEFLIEKMGMMGSLPEPYGYFIADIIVAAATGIVTGWCIGPMLPVIGHWLAQPRVLYFLLHGSMLAAASSSQFFPYCSDAPKRVVLQHTLCTADASTVLHSNYDFAVLDSNSLAFLFKYVPEAMMELRIDPDFTFKSIYHSDASSWLALFPVPFLFSGSLKFPAEYQDVLKQYKHFPSLHSYKLDMDITNGFRRVYLELDHGSLDEVWVTVLNITGPLSNWSFADNKLPETEVINKGPPSYICRLSGKSHENWKFWLEATGPEPLRVDVAVLDQYLVKALRRLKGLFPSWVDVIAYSSFLSTYCY